MPWAKGSSVSRIDWPRVGPPARVDPYLIWLDLVGLKVMGGKVFKSRYGGKLPVLIELHDPFNGLACPGIQIPSVYWESLGRSGKTAHFVSARVPLASIAALLYHPKVKRFQLELSSISAMQTRPDVTPCVAPDSWLASHPLTWIGAIDVGCAFAHRNYRMPAPTGTRVRYVWDQSRAQQPGQKNWGPADKFGYGAELTPLALQAAMRALPDEARCYGEVGCESLLETPALHGFGVLDTAAGAPSPLTAGPPPVDGATDDAACGLPILFVQLDPIGDRDTSISSLGVHVLDGLRYMIDRAERHAGLGKERVPETKLVVNLSYGALAGPHDGSSILERAMDELIAQRENLAVVLAAGNSYDTESTTHARLCIEKGQSGAIHWLVQPNDPTDTFLEIWLPPGADPKQVRVHVSPPAGVDPVSVAAGDYRLWEVNGDPVAGLIFQPRTANGDDSAMLLVALLPTDPNDGGAAPPFGLWKFDIENRGGAALDVHAWVERDDYVAGEFNRRQQATLADPGDGSVRPDFSLSSIAHGLHTVVVGGYRLSDGNVADDSACGPSRGPGWRQGPDVSAPSDEGSGTRGLLVAGSTTGVVNRMSGTSAAAPSATRWIANWFAGRHGNVTIGDLRKAIEAKANRPADADAKRVGPVILSAQLEPRL